MPHPDLHAVRDNVGLRDMEAHRFVACLALDDFSSRRHTRLQWTHQKVARTLGVAPAFTALVTNYLDYRRSQRAIGLSARGIRVWGAQGAQLFLFEDNMPLDLLNLNTSGDRTEQMGAVLREALHRKIRVDPDTAAAAEKLLSRACGMPWETVVNTYQRQLRAQAPTAVTEEKVA
jgi:hypothetical protein